MPILETERLLLRELALTDDGFILDLLNQPSFIRFIGDKGVRTLADARRYLETGPLASYQRFGFGLQLTLLKASQLPIGICGLVKRETLPDPDLGFAFLPQYWGQGYASEAASAALADGRQRLGLERFLGITLLDNFASARVLEKVGLQFQRQVRLEATGPELKLFAVGPEPRSLPAKPQTD